MLLLKTVAADLSENNPDIWYFRPHFSNIGYWGCPKEATNAMLDYSIAEKWKWYCQTSSKFMEKLKMTLGNYIQIYRKGKKKGSWPCGYFLPTSRYHSIYFGNYSNFKSKFSFNNRNIFKIHDYFRNRTNARFNDLCQLINTLSLSNQDFAGFNNFNKLENLFCIQEVARKLNWCS